MLLAMLLAILLITLRVLTVNIKAILATHAKVLASVSRLSIHRGCK